MEFPQADAASQWDPLSAMRRSESQPRAPLRACDMCIRKKVKCDQGHPTCSRCFERGETCTYTAKRRKPGPQRGSHHTRLASRTPRSSGRRRSLVTPRASNNDPSPAESTSPLRNLLQEQSSFLSPQSPQDTASNPRCSNQLDISPEQEKYLLERYFDIAQDANPILSKERFLNAYDTSLCNRGLVSAIVTITAKLTGYTFPVDGPSLDAHVDLLLSSSLLEQDILGDSPSLDQFRKACILSFYEFHQFPGHQSWMRIGRLTRMAYRIGLDRLENMCALYPDWSAIGKEDLQEWRSVWWCIYRLDSYTNLSSGTPYVIEDGLVNTSLILGQSNWSSNGTDAFQELYLPLDSEGLWKLVPTVTSHPETLLTNIHIITVAAMRQAGLVSRVHLLRPQEETIARLANVERHLAALRLALPPGWLNPKRNAFSDETHAGHHARLITVFHLFMAQLLLSILGCGRTREDEWLMSWQRVLETCQDIASIAAQWDGSFCLQVDPAITFTIFTALIFIDLHRKSTAISTPSLLSQIDHDRTVLRLHLEQYASFWTLPRLLTLSFESFSESVSGPLSHCQIALILSRFEAPLHPRWLQFLSSAQAVLDACQ